ncbi:arylmalonate decarboxylase [Mesorhizobium sp. M0496]|uniref:maleate cis-trans isomerase family protein n=1 Tax=Mesorhizobium sp. M0496 TaxID=2956952 RepID=UPI00333952A0
MNMSVRRIGVIYPENGILEQEFEKFAPQEVTLHFTRSRWPASEWFRPNWPDRMASLADDPDIAACAKLFNQIDPAVVTFACTSASFAAGAGGDLAVLENIRRGTNAKASSTSTAYLAACSALGIKRVAIASVYVESVTRRFVDFLSGGGVETVSHQSVGWERQPELTAEDVFRLASECDHPDAQVILIPQTNILTSELIPLVEERLGKPVLTAIQVTVWHAVRLAGSSWDGGIGRVWKENQV